MAFQNEETNIQAAVANYIKAKYPMVLFTIAPSGMKLPISIAKRFKAMGYLAGTPDMLIFEPRKGFHALFLELKSAKGKLSDSQVFFLKSANERHYLAQVCFGYDEAIKTLEDYLGGDKNGNRFSQEGRGPASSADKA